MSEKPGDAVTLGKKFPGEKFSTVVSVESAIKEQELQAQFAHENAIHLSVYFANRRIHDPVLRSMMEAHTKVRHATTAAFDQIFSTF